MKEIDDWPKMRKEDTTETEADKGNSIFLSHLINYWNKKKGSKHSERKLKQISKTYIILHLHGCNMMNIKAHEINKDRGLKNLDD